jgi:predicted alpha/beta hydrolase
VSPSAEDPGGDPITLSADDGFALGATRFEPSTPAHANLIVAGATGAPQRFYRRFAEHARDRGFSTLTLDYRGLGRSAPKRLRGFDMQYLDWARLDLAAAVALMADDVRPLYLVGHSFGGHAFGLLPNVDRIAALYAFGVGAGWHGWMPRREQVKVLFLWHVMGPILTRLFGYLRWSFLGMGEDLPLGVYRQWKRWCRYPRYFFDDPLMADVARDFARVRQPIRAASSLDDLWAPPASRDAFMQGYVNAPWRGIDVDPSISTTGRIDHLGYFRTPARALWDPALEWLLASGNAR